MHTIFIQPNGLARAFDEDHTEWQGTVIDNCYESVTLQGDTEERYYVIVRRAHDSSMNEVLRGTLIQRYIFRE